MKKTVSQSIAAVFAVGRNEFNADLIDRLSTYGTRLELQVNVTPGERVEGTKSSFTDGTNRWHPIRLPKNSFSEPEFDDYQLGFDLTRFFDSLGSTGWNWADKESVFVAFDFDSITGHAAGVGISDVQLAEIQSKVSALDYVEVRRSTGGKGLHLYCWFAPGGEPVNNHNEHAAIGRAVLSRMSQDVGFDLCAHVDVAGSNTWFISKRATVENRGFELLKPASTAYPHSLDGWQNHLGPVKRSGQKIRLPEVSSGKEEDVFARLASSFNRTPLEPIHQEIMAEAATHGTAVWIADHHLLQTHTVILKRIMEMGNIPIQGVFETLSNGTDLNSPNCFCYPLPNGGWKVLRFGLGTKEHGSWTQAQGTHTTCFFNRLPTIAAASAMAGGVRSEKGLNEFKYAKDAIKAVETNFPDQNLDLPEIPEEFQTRRSTLKSNPDGSVTLAIQRVGKKEDLEGFSSIDSAGWWTRKLDVTVSTEQRDSLRIDELIRNLTTVDNKPMDWAVMSDEGWCFKKSSAVKTVLQSMGYDKPLAEQQMGSAEQKPWKMVSLPFQGEYPGGRQWNLNAAALAVEPAPPNDTEESLHPNWDMVFDHIGAALNKPLKTLEWAHQDGIYNGRAYLQAWFANVIRYPFSPLPYLFLYGPQNAGKSILHEAAELLIKRGIRKAERALTSEFNAVLEGCVIAVVEEVNVAQVKGSNDRIKDLVTAPSIAIRRMYTDTYQVSNSSHWIQCSNDIEACPVFPDNTRITVIRVDEIEREIPKSRLLESLLAEAPHFLRTLLDLQLPEPRSRLRLPMVSTDEEEALKLSNESNLATWIKSNCDVGGDYKCKFTDFSSAMWKDLGQGDFPKKKLTLQLEGLTEFRLRVREGNARARYVFGLRLKNETPEVTS